MSSASPLLPTALTVSEGDLASWIRIQVSLLDDVLNYFHPWVYILGHRSLDWQNPLSREA